MDVFRVYRVPIYIFKNHLVGVAVNPGPSHSAPNFWEKIQKKINFGSPVLEFYRGPCCVNRNPKTIRNHSRNIKKNNSCAPNVVLFFYYIIIILLWKWLVKIAFGNFTLLTCHCNCLEGAQTWKRMRVKNFELVVW